MAKDASPKGTISKPPREHPTLDHWYGWMNPDLKTGVSKPPKARRGDDD